jgi:hypothetical protein
MRTHPTGFIVFCVRNRESSFSGEGPANQTQAL